MNLEELDLPTVEEFKKLSYEEREAIFNKIMERHPNLQERVRDFKLFCIEKKIDFIILGMIITWILIFATNWLEK